MRNTTLFVAICIWGLTGCMNQPYAVQGAPGASGKDGSNGVSPDVSVQPAPLYACPSGGTVLTVNTVKSYICNGNQGLPGPQGVAGIAGPVGPQGPIGLPGLSGQNGTNGTVIVPIKFCNGTTSYPSTFLEYGLLIDGKMYGVYSAHDGFWAYLPPGYYSSNAIGSSCNFTINANGTISN